MLDFIEHINFFSIIEFFLIRKLTFETDIDAKGMRPFRNSSNKENRMKEKWWDYRMHSEEACELMFVRAWLVAREKFLSRTCLDVRFNEDGEKYRLPLKWDGLQALREDVETWDALKSLRLTADKHGIPYPLYWSLAFQILEQTDDWRNELAALQTPFIKSSLIEGFSEICDARVLTSENPVFSAKSFEGIPLQKEYINWLIDQVKRRHPANYKRMLQVLVDQGKLPQIFA
jgi:hypothetical protein